MSAENNSTGDSGRNRTHDVLLTNADVLTSRPPSLPHEDRPARILYSTTDGFFAMGKCTIDVFKQSTYDLPYFLHGHDPHH